LNPMATKPGNQGALKKILKPFIPILERKEFCVISFIFDVLSVNALLSMFRMGD